MKRTLLLFCTLVVIKTSFAGELEEVVEEFAEFLDLSKSAVMKCVDNADVTEEDVLQFEEALENNQRIKFDEPSLKIGCLLACLLQKKELMKGADINIDMVQEAISSYDDGITKTEELDKYARIIYKCIKQIKNETNECLVSLKLVQCFMIEM